MFPTFKNKADREAKRQALLNQYNRDLQNDDAKRRAYAETMWASDVEKNKINLLGSKTEMATQTGTTTSTGTSGVFSLDANPPDPRTRSDTNASDISMPSYLDGTSRSYMPDDTSMFEDMSDVEEFHDALAYTPNGVRYSMIDSDTESIDDSQYEARKALKEYFLQVPELAIRKYNPISKYDPTDPEDPYSDVLTNLVFGPEGNVYQGGKRISDPKNIDWKLSLKYIKAKDYVDLNRMMDPFDKLRAVTESQIAEKLEKENADARELFDLINKMGKEVAKKTGIKLFDKKGNDISDTYGFDFKTMNVKKTDPNGAVIKNVKSNIDWKKVLEDFVQRASNDVSMINVNRDSPSNSASVYKSRIDMIYEFLPKLPEYTKYSIHPVILVKTSGEEGPAPRFDNRFAFGPKGVLVHSDTKQVLSTSELNKLNIMWSLSFSSLIKRLRQIHNDLVISPSLSDGDKKDLKKIRQILDITKPMEAEADSETQGKGLMKTQGKMNLKGRGLIGAGRGGLSGYSGTSKNLRSIQGTGTASDLKYKQLGSKFIRVTDLRLGTPKLKLVYPNRTQVGRMIEISKPLAKVIEVLAFDQNVDQQLYNRLSVNDKQIVHDLLRLCHLETTLRDPPADPLEQLQAEFDKLRSQVMLGNDNPDNIRELKALSLDLYNNRLINDAQMRDILSL